MAHSFKFRKVRRSHWAITSKIFCAPANCDRQ